MRIMKKESDNFTKIVRDFKDKWVAVSADYSKVFASGNSLDGVMKKVDRQTNLKVFKVIPFDTVYSPVQL